MRSNTANGLTAILLDFEKFLFYLLCNGQKVRDCHFLKRIFLSLWLDVQPKPKKNKKKTQAALIFTHSDWRKILWIHAFLKSKQHSQGLEIWMPIPIFPKISEKMNAPPQVLARLIIIISCLNFIRSVV